MRLDQLFGKRSARRLGSKQTWPPHQLGGLRRPGTRLADESLFLAARNPQKLWTSMWTTAFDDENSLAWRPTLQHA